MPEILLSTMTMLSPNPVNFAREIVTVGNERFIVENINNKITLRKFRYDQPHKHRPHVPQFDVDGVKVDGDDGWIDMWTDEDPNIRDGNSDDKPPSGNGKHQQEEPPWNPWFTLVAIIFYGSLFTTPLGLILAWYSGVLKAYIVIVGAVIIVSGWVFNELAKREET